MKAIFGEALIEKVQRRCEAVEPGFNVETDPFTKVLVEAYRSNDITASFGFAGLRAMAGLKRIEFIPHNETRA